MRQPPLTELGTALAWLVAVSVVGALMVALAAAESKRPSQNMSRRPWDAVILLGVLAGSWLTFPDGLASSWPPAGFWRRLHVVWKPGARGTSASRQPGWSDFSQRPRSNPASRRTRTSPTGSPHSPPRPFPPPRPRSPLHPRRASDERSCRVRRVWTHQPSCRNGAARHPVWPAPRRLGCAACAPASGADCRHRAGDRQPPPAAGGPASGRAGRPAGRPRVHHVPHGAPAGR